MVFWVRHISPIGHRSTEKRFDNGEKFPRKVSPFCLLLVYLWSAILQRSGLPAEVEWMGYYGVGIPYDVSVRDGFAYVAGGRIFCILDVTDPSNPRQAAHWVVPDGGAEHVFVEGNYAYLRATTGLYIINVEDPSKPSLEGSCNLPRGVDRGGAVYVAGNYAYVTDLDLKVVEVSDPTAPRVVGSYTTPGVPLGVCISGNYAYIADEWSGLKVVDIRDPSHPVFVDSVDTPGAAQNVYVSGNYAYVADWDCGLQIVDVSRPDSIVLVGSFKTQQWAMDVWVSGGVAYLIDAPSGLFILDVSDPRSPKLLSMYENTEWAGNLYVTQSYAYVPQYAYRTGLHIIDIRTPTEPKPTGSFFAPGTAWDVYVSGDRAYVSYDAGFQVIEISNPAQLSLMGSYDRFGWWGWNFGRGIHTQGKYTFVTNSSELNTDFHVFDTEDPDRISLIQSYYTPGEAEAVRVSGDYAYVADSESLLILDVSTPVERLLRLGSCYVPGGCRDVCVSGEWVFVPGPSGLHVIDVTNPASPTLASSLDLVGSPQAVDVAGEYAYVAASWWVHIVHVGEPRNPVLVASRDGCEAEDVCVARGHAYVANGEKGLLVLDVSDPSRPTIAGAHDTPGWARALYASCGRICVADHGSGLCVFEFRPSRADEGTPSIPSIYSLCQNQPNPFSSETVVQYYLATPAIVSLRIFDILGREVRTLASEAKPAGHFTARWDGKDEGGTPVPAGVYLYSIKAGRFADTKKMLLLP